MIKSVFATVALVASLAFAGLALNASPAAALELATAEADVQALIAQYQSDADGLEAAIEDYVTNSEDPEVAAQAVLAVGAGLPDDSPLKIALGRGLGAAIAVIGLTDPNLAATLQALAAASGDEELVAAVSAGTSDKTASIEQNAGGGTGGEDPVNETPDEPASAS